MTEIMVERSAIADRAGATLRFGFFQFAPVGLLSFAVIEVVAVGYGLLAAA